MAVVTAAIAKVAAKVITEVAKNVAKETAKGLAKTGVKVAANTAQDLSSSAKADGTFGESQKRSNMQNSFSSYGQANNMRLTAQSNAKKNVIDPAQQQASQMKQQNGNQDTMQKVAGMACKLC